MAAQAGTGWGTNRAILGVFRGRRADRQPVLQRACWFCGNLSSMDEEVRLRIQAAKAEAWELGYRLLVDEAYNIQPVTHGAFAFPGTSSGTSFGRFLAWGKSPQEAAETGVDVLRGIVERDEPWPES
jgi:hypothetical protein